MVGARGTSAYKTYQTPFTFIAFGQYNLRKEAFWRDLLVRVWHLPCGRTSVLIFLSTFSCGRTSVLIFLTFLVEERAFLLSTFSCGRTIVFIFFLCFPLANHLGRGYVAQGRPHVPVRYLVIHDDTRCWRLGPLFTAKFHGPRIAV